MKKLFGGMGASARDSTVDDGNGDASHSVAPSLSASPAASKQKLRMSSLLLSKGGGGGGGGDGGSNGVSSVGGKGVGGKGGKKRGHRASAAESSPNSFTAFNPHAASARLTAGTAANAAALQGPAARDARFTNAPSQMLHGMDQQEVRSAEVLSHTIGASAAAAANHTLALLERSEFRHGEVRFSDCCGFYCC